MSESRRRPMPARNRLFIVPLSLTLLRVGLAPAVVLLALYEPRPWAFGICLIVAFLSDVFDGVVARRLDVATPGLRRLDSVADTVFYAAAVFAVWRLHPAVLLERATALWALAGLEVTRYAIDFAKFRREASYHMWTSKLWGLLLFLAFFAVLAAGVDGMLVTAAVCLGILADVEGMMISFVLPYWKNDVPTVFHAMRIRRAWQARAG